jgi:riboflavin biosynthesis pyrimidine reductase
MPQRLKRLLPPGPAVDARAFVEELSAQWPSAQAQEQQVRAQAHAHNMQVQSTERPHLLLNMVSTLDGHATLGGRSGAIGNRADRELFHALRTVVDAVLVGAGTARAEHYRQLVRDKQARALRRARGLAEEPLACIVSERLELEGDDIPLLDTPGARVAIVTPSPASLPAECAAQIKYVRTTAAGCLDLLAALSELRERFAVRSVLCEGGPHLNGQLLTAGLVDELFLSLAPKLAGSEASGEMGDDALRIVAGAGFDPPLELELLSALESESHLFLRYRVRRRG